MGTDIVVGDPKFRNPSAGDFYLQSGSLTIDAGSSSGAPSKDFEGRSRPQGTGYDIGAYEYQAAVVLNCQITACSFLPFVSK